MHFLFPTSKGQLSTTLLLLLLLLSLMVMVKVVMAVLIDWPLPHQISALMTQ